jgi:L-iditol 2-dehydrogenase
VSPTDTKTTAVPTRTRAAMLYGARDLRTTELDVPALGEMDVLVRVAAVGVCGSDLLVDRVIECTGVPAVLWASIRAVRPRGRVTVVGQAAPSVDGLPLAHLQRYEIDLVTAFRYAHAYPTAIALVASGAVDIDRIVTGRFGLDRAAEAVQAPVTDPTHLKVVVTP